MMINRLSLADSRHVHARNEVKIAKEFGEKNDKDYMSFPLKWLNI